MVSIIKATETDYESISRIGKIAVTEAHRDAASAEDMQAYVDKNYSYEAIKEELQDAANIYYLVNYNGDTVGFSKIILNAQHPTIHQKNITKLDRIYLLKEFYNLKLGLQLLNFNIELCKAQSQFGIWLFTWIGNKRAINFYEQIGFTIVGSHQFKLTDTYSNENHQMLLQF